MTALWDFYWPVLVAAAVLGLVAGLVAFKPQPKRNRYLSLGLGAAVTMAAAAIWHGPVGAGERLTVSVEHAARIALDNYEMTQVTAHFERNPIRRTLILHGPGNDFQQRQLLLIMNQVPGVGSARWDRPLEPYRGL